MTASTAAVTLLEKAAVDNGFDRELPPDAGWLVFGSTLAPLRIWLRPEGLVGAVVAFSQTNVAREVEASTTPYGITLPKGAVAARFVADFLSVHRLLGRALQLSRALPDELLHAFDAKTRSMPRTTEAERWVVQRVGQDIFRSGLLDYWDGRCAVTGLAVPELLRASHIKPWAACDSDAERLDVFNGLLLAPNLDAAFDGGFVTVMDDGGVELSVTLPVPDRAKLGLGPKLRVSRLAEGHRRYLQWHREHVFRRAVAPRT